MNLKIVLISTAVSFGIFSGAASLLIDKLNKEQSNLTLQPLKHDYKVRPMTGLSLKPGLTIQTWDEQPVFITVHLKAGVIIKEGVYSKINMTDNIPCNPSIAAQPQEQYVEDSSTQQVQVSGTLCLNQALITKLEVLTPEGKWTDQKGDTLELENSIKKVSLLYNGKSYDITIAAIEPCTSSTTCTGGAKLVSTQESALTMQPYIDNVQELITFKERITI